MQSMRAVSLGFPAAGASVQSTQLRPSGVAGTCLKSLPLRKPHVGRREEGRSENEREGREKEGKKRPVGWRNMIFSVDGSSHS